MRFEFFPLRFEFTARESLYFPPGQAANILRGAFGVIFRRLACRPGCISSGTPARTCPVRDSCPYARIFEPSSSQGNSGAGPSGLADWPRPFVFRARHLDGRTLAPGESFHFDLNLFSLDPAVPTYFIQTFAELAREGLGPRRGKAELVQVVRPPTPQSLDLAALVAAPSRIRVEFLTPTELKHEGRIAAVPEFPILFARIRDRISTLRKIYGPGALDIDFEGGNARAASIRMTHCDVRHVESERRSTRTGQSHSIGGFVGVAEYEGDLAEFVPYLEAARWTGVGRQSVWGKGEIAVERGADS